MAYAELHISRGLRRSSPAEQDEPSNSDDAENSSPSTEHPSLAKASVTPEELMARLAEEDDEFGYDGTLDVEVRVAARDVGVAQLPARVGAARRLA